MGEVRLRCGRAPGLPTKLQDRVFEPQDVTAAAPLNGAEAARRLATLAGRGGRAAAARHLGHPGLCLRGRCAHDAGQVDEAMNGIDFNPRA